jgi:glycosyltransferase involved in cell wall biosynthesis
VIPRSVGILTWGLTGGAFANLSAALAMGFHRAGIEELYLVHLSYDSGKHMELPRAVRIIPLGVGRSSRAPIALARFLARFAPEVLISQQAFLNLAAILGGMLVRARTRLIISEHSTMSYEVHTEHKGEVKFRVLPPLMRLLYPRADGLVATSPAVLQDLLQTIRVPFEPSRRRVIPNTVDLERIAQLSREPVDHPWLRDKGVPLILSVGRLAAQKNYPLLLRAFTKIREHRRAHLLIAGEGGQKERLWSLAGQLGILDSVEFLGYMANPYKFMARADVFVLTSDEEAFGLVLVEAMACGVPLVATDAIGGGPRGILDGGVFGTLVPRDDDDALASSILELITSRELHAARVAAGRRRCLEYSPEKIARQWLSLMEVL